MEDRQPYNLHSEDASFSSSSVALRTGTTFDPLAVSPAFARPSSHPPPSQDQSDSQLPHRTTIPALSDPSLLGELPNTDPLSLLLQKHIPPHLRPVRDLSGTWHTSSSSVPDPFSSSSTPSTEQIDQESVQHAALTNSWRKIASLARTQITQPLPAEKGSDELLQWWCVRLYSLARLKLFSLLRGEMDGLWEILLAEGLTEAEGEAVPFTLKVLKATEPKYRGDFRSCVEQYTLLMQHCKQQLSKARRGGKSEDMRKWSERGERLGLMLAFTLAEGRDWNGAVEVLTPLIKRALAKGREQEVESRAHLALVASRIWIQAGDLSFATSLVDRAATLLASSSTLHREVNHAKALIAAITGDLPTATTLLSPSHPTSSTSPGQESDPSIPIAEQLNNAIISFYTANLDSAISTLDQVLTSNPATIANATVADSVVFNLATLYELGTQGGEAAVVERKRKLVVDVGRWSGEPGVSGSSFKL